MLGDAKKKIQRVVDLAEQLYEKVNELNRRIKDTTETVEDTNARVEDLEAELAEQRAILDALAADRDLDVEEPAGAPGEESSADSGDGRSGEEQAQA